MRNISRLAAMAAVALATAGGLFAKESGRVATDGSTSMEEVIGADGEYALDLLMIAKYFERIGDHATNIAGWVAFSILGHHVGKQEA